MRKIESQPAYLHYASPLFPPTRTTPTPRRSTPAGPRSPGFAKRMPEERLSLSGDRTVFVVPAGSRSSSAASPNCRSPGIRQNRRKAVSPAARSRSSRGKNCSPTSWCRSRSPSSRRPRATRRDSRAVHDRVQGRLPRHQAGGVRLHLRELDGVDRRTGRCGST